MTPLFIILLIMPILLYLVFIKQNKYRFVLYFISSLVFSVVLSFLSAKESASHKLLTLEEYGFDIGGVNEFERYRQVDDGNLQTIKKLEMSIMGIGWPVKAIMTIPFFVIYNVAVYLLMYLLTGAFKAKEPLDCCLGKLC